MWTRAKKPATKRDIRYAKSIETPAVSLLLLQRALYTKYGRAELQQILVVCVRNPNERLIRWRPAASPTFSCVFYYPTRKISLFFGRVYVACFAVRYFLRSLHNTVCRAHEKYWLPSQWRKLHLTSELFCVCVASARTTTSKLPVKGSVNCLTNSFVSSTRPVDTWMQSIRDERETLSAPFGFSHAAK